MQQVAQRRQAIPANASATAVATAILAVAGACWVVAVRAMNGMDMGPATEIGPFAPFIGLWVAMMAAMMLPGAIPGVLRHVDARGRLRDAPRFLLSYLAIWAVAGVAIFAADRPHGVAAAGAIAVAAGIFELTPFKRSCRRSCRETERSGVAFGMHCLGSSAGLMLLMVAMGVMSVAWMAATTALVLVQKLLPPKAAVDVPVAAAIVALGVLLLVAP